MNVSDISDIIIDHGDSSVVIRFYDFDIGVSFEAIKEYLGEEVTDRYIITEYDHSFDGGTTYISIDWSDLFEHEFNDNKEWFKLAKYIINQVN